jgi:phosphoenolpyruvate carboxylase
LFNQDKLIKKAARERKELKAELETALNELEVFRSTPASSSISDDMPECAECETHMASLVSLQSKYASLVDELDKSRAALDDAKSRRVLLRPYESCSDLTKKLDDACARVALFEQSHASSSQTTLHEYDVCPTLVQELHDFKYVLTNAQDENTHLRSVLGWVSAREP